MKMKTLREIFKIKEYSFRIRKKICRTETQRSES